MAKTLAITVHPSALGAEYLSVSDAMRHVLDLVEALDRLQAASGQGTKIVWRLKDAHTNSPPFTVVAEASSADPSVSIALEANRIAAAYHETWDDLLIDGDRPQWLDAATAGLFKRIFERNLGPVGRTDITFDDASDPVLIAPQNAERGLIALEKAEIEDAEAEATLARTEYGSLEGSVCGLITFYGKPALLVKDRLRGGKLTCVLSDELAGQVGPEHKWSEAWGTGRRVLIGGAMHFDAAGYVKKIDADSLDEIDPPEVSTRDLRGLDLTGGRSNADHLASVWGRERG